MNNQEESNAIVEAIEAISSDHTRLMREECPTDSTREEWLAAHLDWLRSRVAELASL